MKKELLALQAKNSENISVDDEDVELICQMLQLLMNQQVTTFQFPTSLYPENQAAATELCQSLLAEAPPDLHTLVAGSVADTSAYKITFKLGICSLFLTACCSFVPTWRCCNFSNTRATTRTCKLLQLACPN